MPSWYDFWDVAGTFGPTVLAVMGLVVSTSPGSTDGWRKWVWIGAFAVVAFLTAYWTEFSQWTLEAEITGGESAPFFVADSLNPPKNGQYELVYASNGRPIPDALVIVFRDSDFMHPLLARNLGTIMPVITGTGLYVPPGVYGIQVAAHNGFTYERLEIPASGPLNQEYAVHRPPARKGVICHPAIYYWCDSKPD